MLLQGLAEEVSALGISHKIKIVGGRGIERRAQGCFARIGDRARRQASILIRIVGRSEVQISTVQLAAVLSDERERVHHRRIALQRLADAQPIFKYAGHVRPFFRPRRFALHERSQRHNILHALVRRGIRRPASCSIPGGIS